MDRYVYRVCFVLLVVESVGHVRKYGWEVGSKKGYQTGSTSIQSHSHGLFCIKCLVVLGAFRSQVLTFNDACSGAQHHLELSNVRGFGAQPDSNSISSASGM